MKKVSYSRKGWTTQVKADRAPNSAKNLNHGNNTLIGAVPSTLSLATGRSVYNACGCGACVHFDGCKVVKAVRCDTAYCQMRPNRFESANLIESQRRTA